MNHFFTPFAFRCFAVSLLVALLNGCAGVKVNTVSNQDYLALRRGDVLSTGVLSTSTLTALQVVGTDEKKCQQDLPGCREQLIHSSGLNNEQRMSALAELWLKQALLRNPAATDNTQIHAYLESARYAYAYLFFTERTPEQRALEDRQTQVRDYYNFAVQQAIEGLFSQYRANPPRAKDGKGNFYLDVGYWKVRGRMDDMRLAEGRQLPKEIIPASSLSFAGLRNQYRRDGIGAELIAVTDDKVVSSKSSEQAWSETPFPAVTAVVRFPGKTLSDILETRRVELVGYDPYRQSSVRMAGHDLPLAANFTSGYGLWLARSGFARQSLGTLIGRGEVLEKPHLYLLQPYDPDRRIIIMLHGLASSPEAWINVANEVLGDETLRQNYQIWQIYYPTNLPVALNNLSIHRTITETLAHFDPAGTAIASQEVTLVGHSMGGVLSRLQVSSSGDRLWDEVLNHFELEGKRLEKAKKALGPYVYFEPLPQVSRAIFIAAPHKGTPFAQNRISRWAANLVKLPVSVLTRFKEVTQLLVAPNSAQAISLNRPLNSIDNLSDQDPFIEATSDLPIARDVKYHSIIGNYTPDVPLQDSSDGVVPYASSHLPGAESEKVIPSAHSVQETPEAIIEIRRILHVHLQEAAQHEVPQP